MGPLLLHRDICHLRRPSVGSTALMLAALAGAARSAAAGVAPDQVDVLVVIDNSGSMAAEQEVLATDFGAFIDRLTAPDGSLPSLHVGIVSTDLGIGRYSGTISDCDGGGDGGRLLAAATLAGCTPPTGNFLADLTAEGGGRNFEGGLGQAFGCISRLGIDGCGFEQQLEAARAALDGRNPENAGFLRADALLVVLFITDEDDCSASDDRIFDPSQDSLADPLGPLSSFRCAEFGIECAEGRLARAPGLYSGCGPYDESPYLYSPQTYADFLRGLKSDPHRVVVAGIMGNPEPVAVTADTQGNPQLEPSCVLAGPGEAFPAVRLRALLEQFPDRHYFASICDNGFAASLAAIGELTRTALSAPAMPAPGAEIDAGVEEPDAAAHPFVRGPGGSGCGCRAGGGGRADEAGLLVLAVATLCRRRRRVF